MEKLLIINADDFGKDELVNKGVEKAAKQGILTSATIMTNMPAAQQAVEIAKKLPHIGIGVHLNLTAGKPLTKDAAEILTDKDNNFNLSPKSLALKSTFNPKVRKTIKAELNAQIKWLIDSGINPTHIDSHKFIASYPPIFSIVTKLISDLKISTRRFCREPKQVGKMPWPPSSVGGKNLAKNLRKMSKLNKLSAGKTFKTDGLLGISHLGIINPNFYRAISLYNPLKVSELLTHPGLAEKSSPHYTEFSRQRKIDLDGLCSPITRQHIEKAPIKLIHFGHLKD